MRKRRAASITTATSRPDPFGPPPLLEGENREAYDELVARVTAAVGPADFIEEIWARDIVDVLWTLNRLRRFLAAFFAAEVRKDIYSGMVSVFAKIAEIAPELAKEAVEVAKEAEEEAKEEAKKSKGSDAKADDWTVGIATYPRVGELHAEIMVRELDTIERIERLIAIKEQRFDAIIREIDRHRLVRAHFTVLRAEAAKLKNFTPKMDARKI